MSRESRYRVGLQEPDFTQLPSRIQPSDYGYGSQSDRTPFDQGPVAKNSRVSPLTGEITPVWVFGGDWVAETPRPGTPRWALALAKILEFINNSKDVYKSIGPWKPGSP